MYFSSLPVIDTHEHIGFVYKWRPEVMGLLHLCLESHYMMASIASADAKAAGHEWQDEGISPWHEAIEAKGILSPESYEASMHWIIDRIPLIAQTSDWKAFQYTLRDLFGMEDFVLTRENWRAIDERVREKYHDREAWHREILERAAVKTAFWCYGKPLLAPPCRGVLDIAGFANHPRAKVQSAAELRAAFDAYVANAVADYNPVSMKVGFAYYRNIAIAPAPEGDVDAALASLSPEAPLRQSRLVDDFIHGEAARVSAERSLPLQVHTGTLAGNAYETPLGGSYAVNLEPFITRHPGAKFDIFHGSFPQWGEAVTLARKYPNVYLNMCWVPTLSESMARSMLSAALDAVPINKILFGGDAHSPEMAYGIVVLFREILADVLARRAAPPKLMRGAAEWILHRGASELYRISI